MRCYDPPVSNEDVEFNHISVNGRLGYKSAVISLAKIRGRSYYEVGKVRLTLRGKHLHWKLKKGDKTVLPQRAILWSNENTELIRTPKSILD